MSENARATVSEPHSIIHQSVTFHVKPWWDIDPDWRYDRFATDAVGTFHRTTGVGETNTEAPAYGPLTWPVGTGTAYFNIVRACTLLVDLQRSCYIQQIVTGNNFSADILMIRWTRDFQPRVDYCCRSYGRLVYSEKVVHNKAGNKENIIMNRCFNAAGFVILSTVLFAVGIFLSTSTLHAKGAQSTYDTKCAVCHAKDGSGNTPMGKNLKLRDLRSEAVQRQSDKQLYDIIAKGESPMPGYASQLSKEQITGLVAYIRHLGKKNK